MVITAIVQANAHHAAKQNNPRTQNKKQYRE